MTVRILLALVFLVPTAAAQAPDDGHRAGLDRALLFAIYEQDTPLAATVFRTADWTSTRVFLGAAPALAAGILVTGDSPRDFGAPYRLAITQLGVAAAVYGLKYSLQRERPYAVEDGIVSRSPRYPPAGTTYSFPSGHAALAVGIATSLSLSYPEWWVIAPAATWATLVTLSRPWLGVHYPSDVAVGALVGAGVAVLVHLARDAITPEFLSPTDPDPAAVVPLITIQW